MHDEEQNPDIELKRRPFDKNRLLCAFCIYELLFYNNYNYCKRLFNHCSKEHKTDLGLQEFVFVSHTQFEVSKEKVESKQMLYTKTMFIIPLEKVSVMLYSNSFYVVQRISQSHNIIMSVVMIENLILSRKNITLKNQ